MLEYILALTLVVLYGIFRRKHRKFYHLSSTLGSNLTSLPLLGIAYLFIGGGEVLMKSIQTLGRKTLKNNGVLPAWLAHNFFVVIADPVMAEHVSKACLDKDNIMKKCFKPTFGNANIIAAVSIWRGRRKNLMPPFSPKNLKQFVKVFAEQSETLAERLRPSLGQPVALFDHLIKYTVENSCQSTLGVQLNTQNIRHHPFIEALERMSFLIGERCLKPWLQVDCLYKLLPSYRLSKKHLKYSNDFIDEIIHMHIERKHNETFSNEGKQGVKSVLEQLIEMTSKDGECSELELREEMLIVTAAGMDTSAVAAGFVAAILARHPDVQEKVHTELAEVFESDEPVKPEHLSRLKYLDAVVKETLRLFPPVPIITRRADEDCKLPSGVVLPEGCAVVLHLWAINRSPVYWGADADEFRPERFLESSLKHPAQFATFSLGPRNCIGYKYALMSIQTLFATLVRRYRFLPATTGLTGDGARDQLRLTYGVTLNDVDKFKVELQTRK